MAILLLFPPASLAQPQPSTPSTLALDIQELVKPSQKPNEDVEVLQPLHAAQKSLADKQAADALEAARQALEASQEAAIVERARDNTPQGADTNTPASDLVAGVVGYSLSGGNCVDEAGVNNPGWGNPIQWSVTSPTPWIGASALFTFNHVAVVTGWYANGDLEVRQENAPGMPHRIPMSEVRGFR